MVAFETVKSGMRTNRFVFRIRRDPFLSDSTSPRTRLVLAYIRENMNDMNDVYV